MQDNRVEQQDKNVSAANYRALKKSIKQIEPHNEHQIILVPCSGDKGWYEISEHSALFYYHTVCSQLNIKINFESDSDSYGVQYDIGRIRVHNPDTVIDRVKRVDLYKSHHTTSDHMIVIELTRTYRPAEIEKLKQQEAERRNRQTRIVNVAFSDPVLFRQLVLVSKNLHHDCMSKVDRLTSQTNGNRIVTCVDEMLVHYHRVSNTGKKEPSLEFWQKMLSRADMLLYEINILNETNIWNHALSMKNGNEVIKLKALIEHRIKRLEEKAAGEAA